MEITKDTIIGDVVSKDYRTASIFKEKGIDFCCHGNRSIGDALENNQSDIDQIIGKLHNVLESKNNSSIDYNTWPLDLMTDYIEKKHHKYVETKGQEIIPYLSKLVQVHGGRHPELAEVLKEFKESFGLLAMHMKREELLVFPYIRKMVKAKDDHTTVQASFGSVQSPIQTLLNEHDVEGERFRKISSLTSHFTTPADGCNTYQVTMAMLKEYEEDLHLHIHLENNILFPKAIELEKELASA